MFARTLLAVLCLTVAGISLALDDCTYFLCIVGGFAASWAALVGIIIAIGLYAFPDPSERD